MTDYNASDTKHIRRAAKAAKLAEADRRTVVFTLMSSPGGRAWMHDRLVRCHIFETSYNDISNRMAFAEGERNVGVQDLIDIMRFAPDQYIQMMREFNDKEQANARARDNDRESRGSGANGRRDDSQSDLNVGSVEHEYEPGDEDRVED